jgi:hypothetical protein
MNINKLELKRIGSFIVEFPEEFNIESFAVQKINKPKFTNNKWENIRIDFIDPISPSTSQGLFRIVDFLNKKHNNFFFKFLKNNQIKKLFEIKIKSLDPTGDDVELWIISIEKVLTINFGELDYGNNEIQKPFLIVKPLDCMLNY